MTNNIIEPAGLYIHIPFCIKKCDYCDFYSVSEYHNNDLEQYTLRLIKDIETAAEKFAAWKFKTIYFGGGTPSLLNNSQLERILQAVRQSFHLEKENGREVSLEANPASLNIAKAKDFYQSGINRISLGVQSFFNDDLKVLGRIHTSRDAQKTIEDIKNAGFKNFNLDLIFGIPGQTLKRWQENLRYALDCQPTHISAYLLQLDEDTHMAQRIRQGDIQYLDEELEADMYYCAVEYLETNGYKHYEISNFALPGYECRHNLIYWNGIPYLGLGSGAVSFIDQSRFMNSDNMREYLAGGGHKKLLEKMSREELIVDQIILKLRCMEGIDLEDFYQSWGKNVLLPYAEVINECCDLGLLQSDNGRLYLSPQGFFLSNQVFSRFLH